jgi:uncharacterized protein
LNIETNTPALPTNAQDRIHTIDVIRGIALLGILLVNMAAFNSPQLYLLSLGESMWTDTWNRMIEGFFLFFVQGKFYPIFSFLFGLGFYLFMERASKKTVKTTTLYLRRVFFLFLFGLLHAFLLWYGDILMMYALTALFLLLFRKSQPKTLLLWALLLILGTLIITTGLLGLSILAYQLSPQLYDGSYTESMREAIASSLAAYGSGSYADIFAQRLSDLGIMFSNFFISIPFVLALFLLGVYAGKTGLVQKPWEHKRFLKRLFITCLMVGSVFNTLILYTTQTADPATPSVSYLVQTISFFLGGLCFCLVYIILLLFICQKETWQRLLRPIASAGRLALTNYLAQTIIFTTIFYSYGLGLYGQVGLLAGSLMAISVYIIQVLLSHWWLRYFRFGPMEWLWRGLTYGRLRG